jgi:hypothetical protein
VRLAQDLQLGTLDLIHLAHASIARARFGAGGFVTGDKEILGKSEPIRRTLKLVAIHPDVAGQAAAGASIDPRPDSSPGGLLRQEGTRSAKSDEQRA